MLIITMTLPIPIGKTIQDENKEPIKNTILDCGKTEYKLYYYYDFFRLQTGLCILTWLSNDDREMICEHPARLMTNLIGLFGWVGGILALYIDVMLWIICDANQGCGVTFKLYIPFASATGYAPWLDDVKPQPTQNTIENECTFIEMLHYIKEIKRIENEL